MTMMKAKNVPLMKAAVYHEFGGPIIIDNIPIPSISAAADSSPSPSPNDDAILLQVVATGVCRSDFHGWKGHDGDIVAHGLPFCPGHEVSGVVREVGARVAKFRPGDRVAVPFILSCGDCEYCQEGQSTVCSRQLQPGFTQYGTFAEYVLLPRADRNLRLLPCNVSHIQAASLGCRFSTAYRAVVQQARLAPKESVCVMGAGGVGLACCMIAKAIGCQMIIAVDTSPQSLKKALQLGATHAVQASARNNRDDDDDDVRQQVLELTLGQGAHVSIDAAGFRSTCENAVHCTRRGGRMIQVGLVQVQDAPQIPLSLVVAREIHIIGSHGFDGDALSELLNLVASGKLDPSLLVERQVTLEEGARVLESMEHSSPLGMVMITEFQRRSRI